MEQIIGTSDEPIYPSTIALLISFMRLFETSSENKPKQYEIEKSEEKRVFFPKKKIIFRCSVFPI
ncbi:hypothetical protein OIU78_011291 [Salix suchowensis]|nr:hypothetical protein OIU78_011291 [Salix suchowensis]